MNGLPGAVASYQILYPFAIVTDQHKRRKQQSQRSAFRKSIFTPVSEGESLQPYSQPEQGRQDADNSILTARSQPQSGRAGVKRDTFDSNPTLNQNSHHADKEALKITIRHNPCENGLRCSPRLLKKR